MPGISHEGKKGRCCCCRRCDPPDGRKNGKGGKAPLAPEGDSSPAVQNATLSLNCKDAIQKQDSFVVVESHNQSGSLSSSQPLPCCLLFTTGRSLKKQKNTKPVGLLTTKLKQFGWRR